MNIEYIALDIVIENTYGTINTSSFLFSGAASGGWILQARRSHLNHVSLKAQLPLSYTLPVFYGNEACEADGRNPQEDARGV